MYRLLVLALLVCCSQGAQRDARIQREFKVLWNVRAEAWKRSQCADYEAARKRIAPLVQLALDTQGSWSDYHAPLPTALAQRLKTVEMPASFAADARCVFLDTRADSRALALISTTSALLARKAETAVDGGDHTGWRFMIYALQVLRDPPRQVYVWFVASPPFLLQRATELARRRPPPAALGDELLAAAEQSVMSQHAMCNGIGEEMLAHSAIQFYGHVTELRTAFIDRWGNELATLLTDDYAKRALPSYAAWTAFRAASSALSAKCITDVSTARKATAAQLDRVRKQDRRLTMLAESVLSRVDLYVQTRTELAALRNQLTTR